MRSFRLSLVVALFGLLLSVHPAGAQVEKLRPGDAAPPLAPKTPIKGGMPDLKTETGCVVVHFLVSNEAPSRNSVKVLNRLMKELGGRGLQAVGVFDEDPRDVETFANSGSGAPEYAVASDRDGSSRREWLYAADFRTLPQAFIIGRGGKVLWMGSPSDSGFETSVRKAVTGRFDPPARERIEPALRSAMKCAEVRNWAEAYKHFDDAIDVDPVIALDAVAARYKTTLLGEGKADAANAWLVQTARKRFSADLAALGDLVNLLLRDPEVKPRSPETADKIVDAATAKTGPGVLALRAQVASARGDAAKAVELQTEAWMSAAPADKAAFKRSLDEYRAAAKRQPAGSAGVKAGSGGAPATDPKTGTGGSGGA